MYIQYLAPHVYSKKQKMNRPVYEVYQEVMDFLDLSEKKDQGAYKEKILGPKTIEYATPEYWELGIIVEKGLTPIWYDLSLSKQAEILARIYLAGMVDVVEAHRKAQEDEQKERRIHANSD